MSQNTGKKSLGFHLIFWLGSVCLLLLDQWTKYLACIHLKDRIPVSVIEDVFCLQYLENRGAAFGILQGQKVFFVLITLVFLFLVFWIYHCLPADRRFYPVYVTMMLLLSGAVGNFIDRIFRNYVVDFFYFELINFPIFNVADMFVSIACVVGAVLILFSNKYKDDDFSFLSWKKKDKE